MNNEILARGILGLAASSTSLSIRKIPDYDCTSLVKAYAHAKLVPFAAAGTTISGQVDFFAPESERSSRASVMFHCNYGYLESQWVPW